jgi:hypothetical protein
MISIARFRYSLFLLILVLLPSHDLSAGDYGTNTDFQSWNMFRLTMPVKDTWSLGLQNEFRYADNASELDEWIFKFYAHHTFTERFGLSFGYKHIDRPNGPNEWEPWAELVFPRKFEQWHLAHQVRFEARNYNSIDGILPRVRYLLNWSRQLGDSSRYFTGFGAVRFNVDEKGAGPVSGFEQVRVYNGLGFHIGGFTRLELGYLYRYERSRGIPQLSDHVIQLNMFFTTKPKPKRPMPNDQVR